MTSQENSTYDPDTLCSEFVHRHDILDTQLVRRELAAIYWTIRVKNEIDADLGNHTEELDDVDPLWGLLRSMLDRTFDYTEGAILAYVAGSPASSEVISRTAIESAINLLFILVDERKGSRFPRYLAHYFDNEQREINQWLKATSSLAGDVQKVHQLAATEKRKRLSTLQEATDFSLSQIGLPTTKGLTEKWPKIWERFKLLGSEVDYQTVYPALCSQTHNDAEDLLNYFFAAASGNQELIDKAAIETVNFSRLMLYFSVRYFTTAAGGYAIRFELKNAFETIRLGRSSILKEEDHMADDYEFTADDVEWAFDRARGKCECCGKRLSWNRSRGNPGRGQWEAHHGSRSSPVILCTGSPENCHLQCGHAGNYRNRGITPRVCWA